MRLRAILAIASATLVLAGVGWWFAAARTTAPGEAAPPGAETVVVAYVHDGDTLTVLRGEDEDRVRLIGIDAPEGPGASGSDEPECGADEARQALRDLAPEGAELRVMPDREERDRYGRVLLYAWTDDGRFVNRDLVAQGWADVIRIPPNDARYDELKTARSDAQARGLGIWGQC